MEEADGAVSATRKRITEMELELSTKQREAQQQRTLASSDLSSRRTMLPRTQRRLTRNWGSSEKRLKNCRLESLDSHLLMRRRCKKPWVN